MTIPTAAETAAKVRSGRLSPLAPVEEALARIDAYADRLGALVRVRSEGARKEAVALDERGDLVDLPLAGVPIVVKDNVPVAGEPTRFGSLATPDDPAGNDHEVVRRLRAAGAVVVAISRMPELGIFATSDGPLGSARNPWDPTRTAGGSSGGSATALASGMVPVAHGNDGLGSIRIPAACTGVLGIKPGRGVVPSGVGAVDWFGMAENGPMATTVSDLALALSVMAARPGFAEVTEPERPLRVAVSFRSPVQGVRAVREVVEAVEAVAEVLAAAGHDVRRADPPYPQAAAIGGLARWFAGAAADAEALETARLLRRTRVHVAIGRQTRRLVRDSHVETLRDRMQRFFTDHDVLLTPVLARTPPPAEMYDRGWLANVLASVRYAPFAGAWNLAGYPALALPAGQDAGGLPLAAQIVAPDGGEATLLGLARTVEERRPWPRTAPLP